MNEQLDKLRVAYESLAVRERVLILVAAVGASYGVVDMLFLHPMDLERERLQAAITNSADSIAQTDDRIRLLGVQIEGGIPTGLDREEQALRQQIDVMNEKIDERLSSMIRPDEVARMLEELLGKENDLELLGLSSINPSASPGTREELDEETANQQDSARLDVTQFYRHAFVIELEGTYLATLHYLESIEGLPWGLSWDRIKYEVTEYPRARISIELHTLSREENWIGV